MRLQIAFILSIYVFSSCAERPECTDPFLIDFYGSKSVLQVGDYNVVLRNQTDKDKQYWKFCKQTLDGSLQIKNVATGQCVETPKGECYEKSEVVALWCNGESHQMWHIKQDGSIAAVCNDSLYMHINSRGRIALSKKDEAAYFVFHKP